MGGVSHAYYAVAQGGPAQRSAMSLCRTVLEDAGLCQIYLPTGSGRCVSMVREGKGAAPSLARDQVLPAARVSQAFNASAVYISAGPPPM